MGKQSKGIAFIAFKTQQSMEKALELHNTTFFKKTLTVERGLAKELRPKSEKTVKSKRGVDEPTVPQADGDAEKSRYGANLAKLSGSIVKPAGTKVAFEDSDDDA